MSKELRPLVIDDLEIPIPIVQGGMGVQVSTAPLAAAVADCGAAGTIASVGLGYGRKENDTDFVGASRAGLREQMRLVKEATKGVVGVNVLGALSNYADLARTAVEEKADFLASGAGLPLDLPSFTAGTRTKLVPIVSSARALAIILKAWKKRYDRLPDAVIVEGPLAGGHLGFKRGELAEERPNVLQAVVSEVVRLCEETREACGRRIPVIAAGGVYTGKDIAEFLSLGAAGVQIATRFVATHECSVAKEFKQLYIDSTEQDVLIIDSPVGMPGRAIRTKLIDGVLRGERKPTRCGYRCLRTCNPKEAPYCIAQALFSAVRGDIDNSVVFAGHNVSRVDKIVSVKELIDTLVRETKEALAA